MSPALTPTNAEEVMVIRELENQNIVTCSVPFYRFGVLRIGGRGTIVRMASGASAVFSPVALTEHVKGLVTALNSPIRYIIAPDIEHHIFLGDWKKAFPEARIIGPHGLQEKREKNPSTREWAKIDYRFNPQDRHNPEIFDEFNKEFDTEYFPSHPNREIVVFHKPTKTLLQADMFFNLPATQQFEKEEGGATQGILTKLFMPVWTTSGNAIWQQRLIWYLLAGNRAEWKESLKRIDRWDFERIIPCHGDVIETGGKQVFRKLFGWFLD
ncbi:hypothetical protein LOZ61_006283 [Ophidiomyces ophidiicola]|uniref:uncharacterized protein n=1 Tax=Ophidiomyces ophidiicola TaxID=1387563 RepID=UPI0020C24217|nr:uncharacterized protein LOZ57_004138 [Ophidiomyces ophidiicola]KAI1907151.1 hypothetical protein LOZ61_006283 [Ophidiomyces ophidiicola]KAI1921330.1 hypothetical protein LOZ64_001612 [Ophidiomyces ophidiicola]KAI1922261.1 hypothetical protein LOZ60_005831 [Ophidiomyces ophidiicola]KAI1945452.1 hypothetical protein LOZ57_004138 [Ophidiomyces ophidiicola]KAI1950274.1 hypothetical protein LOZ59_005832 [Ophidiomyces ophidiicola]